MAVEGVIRGSIYIDLSRTPDDTNQRIVLLLPRAFLLV